MRKTKTETKKFHELKQGEYFTKKIYGYRVEFKKVNGYLAEITEAEGNDPFHIIGGQRTFNSNENVDSI